MPKGPLPAYTPRWLYRFSAFVERLPIPGWALALFIILANALVLNVLAWSWGTLAWGQTNVFVSTVGLYQVAFYAQWHFLTRRARPAIKDFFRGRKKSPAQIESILSDFVSLPAGWGTFIFFVGAALGYVAYHQALVPLHPVSEQVLPFWELLSSMIYLGFFSLVMARIIRQSGLTRGLYGDMEVDIFDPAPIYALSRYAVASSVSVLLATYIVQLITLPALLLTRFGFFAQLFMDSSLLLFFFGQLFAINQRMRRAKERLLTQLGMDTEKVLGLVHKAVAKNAFGGVARMQATVLTLKNEQELVQKIPTWPWQPETLRNLLLPMLLPLLAYLIQRFVGAALGF